MRGINIPFCLWLLIRRWIHQDDVRVTFHEPFFYFGRQNLRRNLLALMHRVMAALLLAASRSVYLSTSSWKRYLRPYALLRSVPMIWLPVPTTISRRDAPATVSALRCALTSALPGATIVGHFGTYAADIVPALSSLLSKLLGQEPRVVALCLGANSEAFAAALVTSHPELRDRVTASGFCDASEVSLWLQ